MRYRNSWLEAEIVDTKTVSNNIREIKIMPINGVDTFSVGSHIDVSVIINDQPEIRSYSLVGKQVPAAPYTIAVKLLKESRGGSKYMWSLKARDKIRISQPTNHFELSYTAHNYLMIAGGIGITPIIGMIEALIEKKDANVSLIYIGKSLSDMPYLNRLRELLGNELTVHFSNESGQFDVSHIVDYVTPQTLIYLCGPLGLMNAVRQVWEESDYNNANLRFETFGASGLFAPQDFKVKIPRYNKEIVVRANQTLLNSLKKEGIDVMHDCQKGECGLCQVDIIECNGTIDHRDFFFSTKQKGQNKKMCSCVSRVANGSIVIDTAYRGNILKSN